MGGHDILGIMNACILLGEMSVLPLVEVAVGSACGPPGVLENRLISLSVVVKPTNTSHIFLFSQKFWQLS